MQPSEFPSTAFEGAFAPAPVETLVGLKLDDPRIPTPVFVIDEARLERNINRARTRCRELGVTYRPHVKTHKSIDIARLQIETPEGPITVSTLAEARAFAAAGIKDILYAVGISPDKLPEVARIRALGCDLKVILDSVEMAAHLSNYCREVHTTIPVLIEVDVDGHRSGVLPESAELLEIAAALKHGAKLCGVMTHAGDSYACKSIEAIVAAAEGERAGIVKAAERLRGAGYPIDIVSVGSSPTLMYSKDETGVTEMRAGVCALFDLFMMNLGVCTKDDIAGGVLATVIGRRVDKDLVLIDSGFLALSRDRGTARQKHDYGFGLVCDIDHQPLGNGDVLVTGTNQEHGLVKIPVGCGITQTELPIGRRVWVLPNHACPTAAPYAHMLLVRDGVVKAVLGHVRGWE